MPSDFPALPGFYQALFLYIEPPLTMAPAFVVWFFPRGAEWFHSQLIPGPPSGALNARMMVETWQLGGCYLLIGLTTSLVFRVARDALRNNLEIQERIIGAGLTALAVVDVAHVLSSWIGLPEELRFAFGSWNLMAYGNIVLVIVILAMRLAWFAGIGRQRYYYGKPVLEDKKSA